MKYCTSTKWHHPVGFPDQAGFVEFIRGILPPADVEYVFLWRIDDHHHGSLTVYPDEEAYLKFKADLKQARDNITGAGITMTDSNEGPLLGHI